MRDLSPMACLASEVKPDTQTAPTLTDSISPGILQLAAVPASRCRHRNVLAHAVASVGLMPADLTLRLAALLQNVGKPSTLIKRHDRDTFPKHEIVGSRVATRWLEDFLFPGDIIRDVSTLVRMSNRLDNLHQWTDTAVRRYVKDAGEHVERINALVRADWLARGDLSLRDVSEIDKLEERIAPVRCIAVAASIIRPHGIDGHMIMARLSIKPGPVVGKLLKWVDNQPPSEHRSLEEWMDALEKHRIETYDNTGKQPRPKAKLRNRLKMLLRLPEHVVRRSYKRRT